MDKYIDGSIVALYFAALFVTSFIISKKNRKNNDKEFLTGGNDLNWKQTGMTLIAMMFNPGIMGNTALAFIWGGFI
jgi:Na+/proline symporter